LCLAKVTKTAFLSETIRTKKSNGVRFCLIFINPPQSAAYITIYSLLYRYFQFDVLPYRQSERTECFLERKGKKIAAAFPPRTDISSNICFYPLSTYTPTVAHRSMCFSERFYGKASKTFLFNPKLYSLSAHLPGVPHSDSYCYEVLKECLCETVVLNGVK